MTRPAPRKKRRARRRGVAEAVPRYLQIARDLQRGIAAGRYPVGAQLPTEHGVRRPA